MLAQRVAQQSLRRCTYCKGPLAHEEASLTSLTVAAQPTNAYRFAAPAAVAMGVFNNGSVQRRSLETASFDCDTYSPSR